MKILYVINALTIGGAQTLLADLVKSAIENKNEVYVAAFRGGIYADKLKDIGAKVVILGEKFFDLIAFVKLIKLIRKIKPDIIHSHLFRASMWARFASLFCLSSCLITTIHGKESKPYIWLEKFIYSLSDKIIFSSDYLCQWYNREILGNNEKKIPINEDVLYPGTEINTINSFSKGETNLFTIGVLSRLHEIKGIDFLLNALSKVKNTNYKLLIGGDGIEKPNLIKLAKKLKIMDKCEFLGNIYDKNTFLEKLDLFISPSRDEGFGINVCEALERSIPVYASNIGGIKEIIKDGVNGRLFSVNGDNDSLNNLIEMLNDAICGKSKNLLYNISDTGRKTVKQYFDRKNTLLKYMQIYENMSQSHKRKIHFLVSSCELGGGERLALGLMKSLLKRGYEISLTCAGNPLAESAESEGIKVSTQTMKSDGIFYAIKATKDIIKIKPDYISSHLNKAGLIGGYLGKIFGIKTLAHIHGLNRLSYYKNSDRIIAVSQAVKDHICNQGISSDKVLLICNCIDKPALSARKLENKKINIGIIAKLHANKGHEWALKAIAKNINKLNIEQIHIVGDGPEKEKLHLLCSNEPLKNLVKFYGFVNNVDEIYKYIDVALLPSAGEGIPLSLLEAMRFGIPSVATDRGGIPEIVTNNKNGLLIPYGDENALIEALNKMSNPDEYNRFSNSSINAFKRLNNYEKMVDEFEKLL